MVGSSPHTNFQTRSKVQYIYLKKFFYTIEHHTYGFKVIFNYDHKIFFIIALSKIIKKFKNYVKVCERLSLAKQMYDRNT